MPIITISCRPKNAEQRHRALRDVASAAAAALEVKPELVQVFIAEYDDEHWYKGSRQSRG
jgi:phenylpyruvate tautomerase PptA (4-oxalocrotonate tautomerase family)